jgi:DNA invertase Pin-like site-specific DNA recombinase
MKRASIYTRVSTLDQTTQNQLLDLRALAQQRGFQIAKEYTDRGISGTRARRPGLSLGTVISTTGVMVSWDVW